MPQNVFFGEIAWRYPELGVSTALEARRSSRLFVDDLNSASAPGYTVANLRGGFEQISGNWRFTEFARVDNLFNTTYIGSVIVAETNGRFFEPSPRRTGLVGAQARYSF